MHLQNAATIAIVLPLAPRQNCGSDWRFRGVDAEIGCPRLGQGRQIQMKSTSKRSRMGEKPEVHERANRNG
jgi:hypothetical protein